MDRTIDFIERFFNSIRFNGFYILLALLFPFILYKFDAGAEIIVSMAEQGFALNIGLSLLAFSALCLSIWCIPTLAIWIFQFIVVWKFPAADRSDNALLRYALFRKLVRVYNGQAIMPGDCCTAPLFARPQLPVRYFAIAPWGLFIITCLKVYLGNGAMIAGLLVIPAGVFIVDRLRMGVIRLFELLLKRTGFGAREAFIRRYAAGLTIYFGVIIGIVFLFQHNNNTVLLKVLLCSLNALFLFGLYAYLLYMENSDLSTYLDRDGKPNIDLPYKVSNVNYWVLLSYLLLAVIIFYVLNQYQLIGYVSPAVVLVIMCTALIVFFELVFTAQLLLVSIVQQVTCTTNPACILTAFKNGIGVTRVIRVKLYRLGIIALVFVVVNLYFFSSSNSHKVRAPEAKAGQYIPDSVRPVLTDYFQKWYDARNTSDDSTVYLISGQGGGSRAAAWFFMNMLDLENRYPGFAHKVFSISTVSGSTTGANMYLASKFYKIPIDSIGIKNKATELYGRNYMSSAFYGLLLGDFLESKADIAKPYPRDRNVHLQLEEEKAFRDAFNIEGSDQFFEQDFMTPYLKSPLDSGRKWPLFLINTTIVNFGTRAVFSPVRLNDVSVARDLYGEFKNNRCNSKANLPQVVLVNQSQAFPILSAYNWLECIGRLGDGGISENSGCATTLEIYQELRRYCDQHNLKKIKFVCLNITNGNLDSDFKVEYENASIFNTINAGINSPFDGSETYAFRNLDRQLQYFKSNANFRGNDSLRNRDTVVNCSLDTSITLTRTMSRKSADTMFHQMAVKRFKLLE